MTSAPQVPRGGGARAAARERTDALASALALLPLQTVVLGIDPGTLKAGAAWLRLDDPSRVESRQIVLDAHPSAAADARGNALGIRLNLLRAELRAVIIHSGAGVVVIEMALRTMTTPDGRPHAGIEAKNAGHAVVRQVSALCGTYLLQVRPQDGKIALCGDQRATKTEMRRAAAAQFDRGAVMEDEADAIGLVLAGRRAITLARLAALAAGGV